MSDESEDIKAAQNCFLSILESESEKQKKELIKLFLNEYLKAYAVCRKQFKEVTLISREAVLYNLRSLLSGLSKFQNKEQQAARLGHVFGVMLGFIDFIIVGSFRFSQDHNYNQQILAIMTEIASVLRSENHKVRLSFIQRRVTRISRRHGNALRPEQKELLVSIAAIFAQA